MANSRLKTEKSQSLGRMQCRAVAISTYESFLIQNANKGQMEGKI